LSSVHPQTLGVPPPPQLCPVPVHAGQVIVPLQPLLTVPHCPVAHVLGTQHGVHCKVPPHPSDCAPQSPAHVFFVHPQTPAVVPPPQVLVPEHVQFTAPPH